MKTTLGLFAILICAPLASGGGFLDGVSCTSIYGWAWNGTDNPVNVEILDGARVVANLPANQYRQDLKNAGIGNGSHGFSCLPQNDLRDGAIHILTTRIYGTTQPLPSSGPFVVPTNLSCSYQYDYSTNLQPVDGSKFTQNGTLYAAGAGGSLIYYGARATRTMALET